MFEFDRSKLPELYMTKSILDMYDENYIVYTANGIEFNIPSDEDLDYAEKHIYAWIAWYEKVLARRARQEQH